MTFGLCSDEEGEPVDGLWYLPVAPEIDDPEENPLFPIGALPPDSTAGSATVAAISPQSASRSAAAATASLLSIPPPIDIALPAVGGGNFDAHPLALGLGGGRKKAPPAPPPAARETGKRKGKASGR